MRQITDIESLLEKDNKFVLTLCDEILFVLGRLLDPIGDSLIEFERNEAVIVGLFAKQYYLFDSFITSCKANKDYECLILQRIIYEAFIKMSYLIHHEETELNNYRLCSYKSRFDFYREHASNSNGIEVVRNKKFLEDLFDDGFTLDDAKLLPKAFGGKNMRQLIEEEENDEKKELYNALYSIGSDMIHSDWGEIRQLYLQKVPSKNYVCCLDAERTVHYRYIIGMAQILIDSAHKYGNWLEKIKKGIQTKSVITLLEELECMTKLIMSSVFENYEEDTERFIYE